jgi:MFS family permease
MTVGALMAAGVGSLALLAVSQIAIGLGHVTNLIAGQALVANRGGRERRDQRYGYYSTMGSLGHLAGPLLGTALVSDMAIGDVALSGVDNPQAPAFLAAAAAALAAFGLAWLLPRRRSRRPTGDVGPEAPVGLVRAVRGVLARPGMPFAMAVSMIVVSSVDVLIAYLPLYGETRGLTVATVGVLLAIRAGASMVSRIFMGYLIERLGRNRLVAFSMGAATIGLVALPLVDSALILGALMVLIGLGLGIGQPMTMAWVANRSARAERATALGVRLTGNRTALVVMPVIVGGVAGAAGVNVIFWLMALLLGGGAIVGYRAPLDVNVLPVPDGHEEHADREIAT